MGKDEKKKKGGKGKWIVLILIIIILIAAIASCGGNDDKPTKVNTSSTATSASSNTVSSSKGNSSTAASSSSAAETFTIGDTADFDGVQVKLSSAILSKGSEYVKPDDGKYFIGLIFDIDNQSSKDLNISSMVSFEAYCDDYSLNQDITGKMAPEFDGLNQLDGSVAAGKKMSGVICFQVPQDFQNFEISCAPDFWGNKKVTFQFTRDQVDASAIQ